MPPKNPKRTVFAATLEKKNGKYKLTVDRKTINLDASNDTQAFALATNATLEALRESETPYDAYSVTMGNNSVEVSTKGYDQSRWPGMVRRRKIVPVAPPVFTREERVANIAAMQKIRKDDRALQVNERVYRRVRTP